jgi:hypothetical protein
LQWLCVAKLGDSRRNMTADLVCFLVLTPLVSSFL